MHITKLAHLLFPDFVDHLAIDAQGGGRASFKSLDADLNAAGLAETKILVIEVADGFINLLDQLAFTVTGA